MSRPCEDFIGARWVHALRFQALSVAGFAYLMPAELASIRNVSFVPDWSCIGTTPRTDILHRSKIIRSLSQDDSPHNADFTTQSLSQREVDHTLVVEGRTIFVSLNPTGPSPR